MNHIDSLRTVLDTVEAEALLLTSEVSQRYAVDFAFSDGYVLITPRAAYLVTDARYLEEATATTDACITVVAPAVRRDFIFDTLQSEGIRRVGIEDRALTLAERDAMFDGSTVNTVAIGGAIEALRAVKNGEELERIRAAQAITDAAFSHILSALTPTMTEVDVVLELEFFMRRNGADAIAFPTIAVSGASSALPHGLPSRRPLSRGFLTMDFGASVRGYASDMTRTVVLGRATDEMRRLYRTVSEAQELGMAAIAPGVTGVLVDGAARAHIDSEGYKGLFGHGFGHGVGLEIHEAPRLSLRGHEPLCVGNVVTAEPGIYRMGEYGCRIENMGVVTSSGFECFTKSTKELIELF